ncbi:WD and tetratricopeptide repeat-containing protein [Lindgomyces ingoldianus]|uniref:WD and tetratricopeptide repeat-containing protein n=1 Tax=Lindgomyces ingoldianus TaxID=673940 RepID=A0ACB6RB06_9PLEO|nr:WD and tetratricopeptide repeat-containing protein [Lindgomyces ingoldianus]KAF2476321.1 WD and tetratricopeptide repeat-containing protein [Lindgomyces ingoldianus]
MKHTVYDRLLRREIGQDRKRYSSVRGIYGDRQWVEDMDIVNELEGHNGCVNALCWSRSGRLLASGSDDHRINIHSYHPESSNSQFNLTTSIVTGHSSNIFSVKFMPYSNDRTIVSATDDVRIFDIEYSGHSALGSSSSGRRRTGINGATNGVTLTEGDTNAKAFRSHSDTVKRIVTEDNPFYFLTCSEDGDVRQWDIRQPSKTYPAPKDSMVPRWAADAEASDSVPPPLISYSRYHLDINTVSCSPSQPHYIALGGAHLHCFLHDRRMLGRDKLRERGTKLSSPSNWSDHEGELFGKATQCVRKFAPNGRKRMRRADNGHITACKISDANPNEMVVSWSGDWIYSFDLLRSPDASEEITPTKVTNGDPKHRVKDKGHKRKRTKSNLLSEEAAERAGSRQRTESSRGSVSDIHEQLSLRVNYGNGQSEEIRIEPPGQPRSPPSEIQHTVLPDSDHFRIARAAVRIQKQMFALNWATPADSTSGPSSHRNNFTSVLGLAASIIPEVDDISRTWRYPINPNEVDVALQNKLRDGRAATRRFIQVAGTLARVLGGQLRTGGNATALISQYFSSIQQPAPNERPLPRHEQFGYDFLKAILLWLDSGLGALVEGFSSRSSTPRLPIGPDADVDAVDDELIPYLLQLASENPIVDVDVSRFERDDTRVLFSSEKAAVIAFARALKMPFADLTGAVIPASESSSAQHNVQDRKNAISQWAFKVGRGVLLNASKDIRFIFVDRSFGGLGLADSSTKAEEKILRERQEDVDPLEEDDAVADAELVSRAWAEQSSEQSPEASGSYETASSSQGVSNMSATHSREHAVGDTDEDEDDDDSDGDIDPDEDEDEDEEADVDAHGLSRTRSGRILWRSDFDRSRLRERVESEIPCSSHTRTYTGHCNVRTVKDVNFFGLQDEYVVSGSDSGHVFIWDRKTSQLLNILEGDGETVNVVQGHPYEPTMAVSGIDHTIKIFSPDAQEQRNARKGIGVHSVDPGFSTLGYARRRWRSASASPTSEPAVPNGSSQEPQDASDDDEVALNGLSSKKRMHKQYQITSQNDMERKGGRNDAFITRALLAQLAQRIHAHSHIGGEEDEDGEEGGTIFINNDDVCTTM